MLLRQDISGYLENKNDLTAAYKNIIPESERCCTEYLDSDLGQLTLSAVRNKKILVNCHFMPANLMLIAKLSNAGAKLKVTRAPCLMDNADIKQKLEAHDLYMDFEELAEPEYTEYFDLIIDYAGFLANSLIPKICFIELSQVDPQQYRYLEYPVFSVDYSFIKYIETSLGVGDGFVRALKPILTEKNKAVPLLNYLIIGYGKAGKGIVRSLIQAGTPKSSITIADVKDRALEEAISLGLKTYNLVTHSRIVSKLLPAYDCVVSVTGLERSIARYFEAEDFDEVPFLINMGAHDEWGPKFADSRILNNRKPLNYMLDIPTRYMYLDPIIALTLCTAAHAVKLRLNRQYKIMKAPKIRQKDILNVWLKDNKVIDSLETLEKITGKKYELF